MITDGPGGRPVITLESADSLWTHYELGKTIGRGEFAKVKLARCRTTHKLVAIKIVPMEGENARREERLQREMSILAKLQHPYIIELKRVIRLPDCLALVMDYISGGELFDYVQRRGRLPEHEIKSLMIQLFKAVSYLHSLNIVHRDLKLENLLLDGEGSLHLTDFGFATRFNDESGMLHTACGSPCYAAPELVLNKAGYKGPGADLWSCGVIMYAMSFGYLPFESDIKLDRRGSEPITWTPKNVYQLYQHISENPIHLPKMGATETDNISVIGRDLLIRLLNADPTERIDMESVWQHSWWNEPIINTL